MHKTSGIVVAIVIALSGCAHAPMPPAAQTTTDDHHASGWHLEIRAEARRAWPYAQLSGNAYAKGQFALGDAYKVIEQEPNDAQGFGYMVVERRLLDGSIETIVVFRGTDFFTWEDWRFGNIGAEQNRAGLALVDRVRSTWADESGPIVVTGHSLGGGIAMHVSLHRKSSPGHEPRR